MNKKYLLIILILFIMTSCNMTSKSISLMEYGDYQNITEENIEKIEIIKYTIAGDNHELVEDDSIINVYNYLKEKKIGPKTNMSCEDNTTIYTFTLKDEIKISIEIECDWVVIDNNRYILK